MDDLVTFLKARFDEDEQTAHAAARQRGGPEWEAEADPEDRVAVVGRYRPDEPGYPDRPVVVDPDDNETAVHIARHDPARVLRDIDAKRELMKQIFSYEAKIDGEWGCCHDAEEIAAGSCPETPPAEIPALRLLASVYADHPSYREDWRP